MLRMAKIKEINELSLSETITTLSSESSSNCYCGQYLAKLIRLPWIKCKTLYRKIVKRKKSTLSVKNVINDDDDKNIDNISKIFITTNNSQKSNDYNNNDGGNNNSEQLLLLIKCPNCHRKSMVEESLTYRSSSMWQLATNINDRLKQLSSTNLFNYGGSRSQPNTPACMTERSLSSSTAARSPSNYCRVATCEKLHIHDITPKCLETFAPSSTCSSCQYCDRKHIGPNHDQLLMVKRLIKELPLITIPNNLNGINSKILENKSNYSNNYYRQQTSSLLMQWPLPEYRPQNSPDHLYRIFEF